MLGNPEMERRLLEKTYDGSMAVYTAGKEKLKGESVLSWSMLHDGIPCALSMLKVPELRRAQDAGGIEYTAVLFCAPEIEIPPGSRITVTQYGRETAFCYSGECIRYPTHQELSVKREGDA